jgi:hypothetical protein
MHDSDPNPPAVGAPPSAPSAAPGEEDLFPPPDHRASPFRRTLAAILGGLCLIAGIILGILPIVPGFPLIAVGVLLLVASSEPSRRLVNRTERWLPRPIRCLLRRIARRPHRPA